MTGNCGTRRRGGECTGVPALAGEQWVGMKRLARSRRRRYRNGGDIRVSRTRARRREATVFIPNRKATRPGDPRQRSTAGIADEVVEDSRAMPQAGDRAPIRERGIRLEGRGIPITTSVAAGGWHGLDRACYGAVAAYFLATLPMRTEACCRI